MHRSDGGSREALAQLNGPVRRSPAAPPPLRSLSVQRLVGNRATGQILQAKLTINEAGDVHEQEADRIADEAMRMPAPSAGTPPPHQGASGCGENLSRGDGDQCQSAQQGSSLRSLAGPAPSLTRATGAAEAPPIVHTVLRSPGQPLDRGTRDFMEPRLGLDLSHVRVHTDGRAAQSARAVNALAYTVGRDVVFGAGQHAPGTEAGRRLLAHELAHVGQQGGGTLLQRFEAGIHEATERQALAGDDRMTQEEATAVYFGNWMRDVNQALVPAMKDVVPPDVRFALLSYMALKKFGQTMSPRQLGFYIPAEHIDNPAGMVANEDFYSARPRVSNTQSVDPLKDSGLPLPTPQEGVDPRAKVGGASLFAVDESGVMAFARRSNLHVERRLQMAAKLGRTPEGMHHLGAALHAIEDLFAHSNWIEISLAKVLADNANLLKGKLSEKDRDVFRFSGTVTIAEQSRPVLTTGTFTSGDTAVSVGHEFTAFLRKGLQVETDPAVSKAQEELVGTLVRIYGGKMAEKFYDITKLVAFSLIPDDIKQEFFDTLVNPALRKIADQTQAAVLEQGIASTNLLEVRKQVQSTAKGQFSAGQVRQMEATASISGKSVEAQKKDEQARAAKRLETLDATPAQVLAGPSHSQIAKDHPSSIFFGLAVTLAAIADRVVRDKMLDVWAAGGFDTPFAGFPKPRQGPPAWKVWVSDDRLPREQESFAKDKKTREQASAAEGAHIVAEGGAEGQQIDLVALRNSSADNVATVATLLRKTVVAPSLTKDKIDSLRGLLGKTGSDRMEALQKFLSAGSEKSGQLAVFMQHKTALLAIASKLEAASSEIREADSYDKRAAANKKLVAEQQAFVKLLTSIDLDQPSAEPLYVGGILTVVNREVASTAVSYTSTQKAVLADPKSALKVESMTLPEPDVSTLPKNLHASYRTLVQETRKILNHPYESDWWVAPVTKFIKDHPDQIATEIKARSQGYAGFRASDEGQ